MALVACLDGKSSSSFSQLIDDLVTCFDNSLIDVHFTKTKEQCLGGKMRNNASEHTLTMV
jgi:hypothetical protein